MNGNYDIKFLENTFMLHFLFDPYIANIGSSSSVALKEFITGFDDNSMNFTNYLTQKYTNKEELKNLLEKYNKTKNLLTISNEFMKKKEQIQDKITSIFKDNVVGKAENNITDSVKNIEKFIEQFKDEITPEQLSEINTKNINTLPCKYGLYHEKSNEYVSYGHLFQCILIPPVIENFIDKMIEQHDQLFIPSGYYDRNKFSGHLIGLYYSKINNTDYKIVLTNSGNGLQFEEYHPIQNEQYGCILSTTININKLKEIFYYEFFSHGLYDDKYNVTKYYDNIVSRIFNTKNINIKYRPHQYSGSCTFYGIYYFIDYYFDNDTLFAEWNDITKKALINKIENTIIHNVTYEYIHNNSNINNFIDMLLFNYKDNLTKPDELKDIYKNCVKTITKIEGNTNFKTNPSANSIINKTNENVIEENIYTAFDTYDNMEDKNICNALESLYAILVIFEKYDGELDFKRSCIIRKISLMILNIANSDSEFYKKKDNSNPVEILYKIFNIEMYDFNKHWYLYIFIKINEQYDIIKHAHHKISEDNFTAARKYVDSNIFNIGLTIFTDDYIFPYFNFDANTLINLFAKYINYIPIQKSQILQEITINTWAKEYSNELFYDDAIKFNRKNMIRIKKEKKWNKFTYVQKKFMNVLNINTDLGKAFKLFLQHNEFIIESGKYDNKIIFRGSDTNKLLYNISLSEQNNNLDYISNLIKSNKINILNEFIKNKFADIKNYAKTKLDMVLDIRKLNGNFKLCTFSNSVTEYDINVNIVNKLFDLDSELFNDQIDIIHDALIHCQISDDTLIALFNILFMYCPTKIKNNNEELKKILIEKIGKNSDVKKTVIFQIFYTMYYYDDKFMNEIINSDKNENYFCTLIHDYIILRDPKIFKNICYDTYTNKYDKIYNTINRANDYLKKNNILIKKTSINNTLNEIQLTVYINNTIQIWNVIDIKTKLNIVNGYFVTNYLFYYMDTNDEILYYGMPISKFAHNNIVIKKDTFIYNNNYVYIHYEESSIYNNYNNDNPVATSLIIETLSKIITSINPLRPTDYTLLWKYNDVYMFEFPYRFQYNSNKHLIFIYKDNNIYYENYKIITSDYIPIFNNWIYGLENAIIMENIDNHFDKKILLCTNIISRHNVLNKHSWEKINSFSKIRTKIGKIKSKLPNDNIDNSKYYHIIDIHYTGLTLNFNNDDALFQYFLECIYGSKNDCLYAIFNNFINKLHLINIHSEEQNTEYGKKHPITAYTISQICKNNLYNVPCKYYYAEKLKSITNNDINDSYKRRFENNKYPKQYRIELGQIKNKNFKYKFKYSSLKDTVTKLIQCDDFPNIGGKNDNLLVSSNEFDIYNQQINDFINSRKSCNPNIKNINLTTNDYKNILDILNNKFIKYINALHDLNYSFSKFKNIEKIYENRELLFKIMECKNIIEIFNKIRKMKETHCYEILKLQDMLDTAIIYNGIRDISVVIFEILFGSFVRNDQYELYNKIKNEKEIYDVHQMLMGKGKSSVITPLLTFHNIFFNQNISNVLITIPSHLTKQTYDNFIEKFTYIMENITIQNIKIDRDEKIVIKNKNIIIIDDTSLKSVKLNSIINKNDENIILNKSFVIMDEFDNMINPMSSELNFPLDVPTLPDNSYFIFNFIVKTIKKILNDNNYKEIKFTNTNDSTIFINAFFSKYNYNEIMDTNEYENEYKFFVEYCVRKKENIIIDANEKFFNMVGILRKIYNVLILSLTYIYRKDYGFGDIILSSPKNYNIAIPFGAVDEPVNGSEFTDPELTIILTSFSYFYRKITVNDLQNIVNYGNQKKSENPDVISILLNKYFDIFKSAGISFDYILNCANDILIGKILNKVKNNINLIENYVVDIILPEYITIYKQQYNCSFIDVMTSTFTKYKTAFSGTVNVFMPELTTKQYEFNEIIKPDDLAMGDIICAITGGINFNTCKYINNDIDTIVNYLFENENKYQYQCLIDTGAFMKNHPTKTVIEKIAIKFNDEKKKYIFIDDSHKKMVYSNNVFYELGINKYDTNEIFIYYDHKHTIGIDIQQPYNLKGLATVDYFNRFTDMAQGIYRLRKLNYGHTIDFIVSKTYENINTTRLLFKQLMINENNYKQNSKTRYLLQNIKYLKRQVGNNKQEIYIDDIFYEKVTNISELKENLFNNYIKYNYCKQGQSKLILKLCNEINTEKMEKIDTGTHKAQQIIVSKEKTISRHIAVETSKYNYGNIKLDWKNINDKYTLDDYININIYTTSNDNQAVQFLKNNNIYLSPIIYAMIAKNILNNRINEYLQLTQDDRQKKLIGKLLLISDDKSLKIQYFTYYYIKSKINNTYKYLILFPNEFHMLHMYIFSNKIKNVILKDNNGKIIYGDINDELTEQEYLIQMLTGNDISIGNHVKIFNYLTKNNTYENMEIALQLFSKYSYKITNFMIFYLGNKNNYETIIKQKYIEKQYDGLLTICGMGSSNLSNTQKIQILYSDNVFKFIFDKYNLLSSINIDINETNVDYTTIISSLNDTNNLLNRKNNITQLLKLLK